MEKNVKKIPTAQDFVQKYWGASDAEMERWIEGMRKMAFADDNNVYDIMQEFAKLHVEAALKAAAENAKCIDEGSVNRHGDWSEYYVVDKESILSVYPLNNIK